MGTCLNEAYEIKEIADEYIKTNNQQLLKELTFKQLMQLVQIIRDALNKDTSNR